MAGPILIVASLDTKWPEVKYLKELIEKQGMSTLLLDTSTRGESPIPADIPSEAVAEAGGCDVQEIRNGSIRRDRLTSIIIKGAIQKTQELFRNGRLGGIVGIGGVSNTAMATEVMKSLPFGVPKLMVSSGAAMPSYSGQFFGSADIAIISSVVDVDGLHALSRDIIERSAGAIVGMVKSSRGSVLDSLRQASGHLAAATEFHYSELCSELVRQSLSEKGYTVIPCHADGVGDRAMENLLEQGIFDLVVDVAAGGVSEELFGGNRAGGPKRLEGAVKRGLPLVLSPCGFDMISCGPLSRRDNNDALWTSRGLAKRKLYIHDAYRVQARTTAEELKELAGVLARKLNPAAGPVRFLVPLRGWSSLSEEGQRLHDPEADRAFVEELRRQLRPEIGIEELDMTLNSSEFAAAVVDTVEELMKARKAAGR